MNDLPRQKLCELIAKYGESLCDEPLRLEGLLRDLCPKDRGAVNLLVNALREGVATELRNHSVSVPIELTLARPTKRLQDHQVVTEEGARWAVESWALALGKITEHDPEQTADVGDVTSTGDTGRQPSAVSFARTTACASENP